MTESPADGAGQDAAWVSVELPWAPPEAFAFAADIERLFRINPHAAIEAWAADGSAATTVIRMRQYNELSGQRRELAARIAEWTPGSGYRLEYSEGIKRATTVSVVPQRSGSLLTLRDDYLPVAADDPRLVEVDRSISAWGYAIRRHVLAIERWAWIPGYRRFIESFWLTMSPKHRRISWLIIWTSVIEFAVFAFVLAIYWLENLRPGH